MELVAKYRRQYRSRVQIAAGILEIAKNGSHKTRIMYLGNLSFDLLQKYLNLLLDSDLVELAGDGKTYLATEKGKKFLEDFQAFQSSAQAAEEKKRVLERSLAASQIGSST
jgi:predicted transcriptional regulator